MKPNTGTKNSLKPNLDRPKLLIRGLDSLYVAYFVQRSQPLLFVPLRDCIRDHQFITR